MTMESQVFTIYKIIYSAEPTASGIGCKCLRRLVGASGFEPPTSWSRTRMTKKINELAMGIAIVTDFDRIFQIRNLWPISEDFVETDHALSMHGVGIVLGIVGRASRGL
jgi:hypothetical protein